MYPSPARGRIDEGSIEIWTSPKPSMIAKRVTLGSPHAGGASHTTAALERAEASRTRRSRAVWPRARVETSYAIVDRRGVATTTSTSFRTDELLERCLDLVPLEGEADRALFVRRLEALANILGANALSSSRDGDGRTLLWYAVDAEDAVAVNCLVAVFRKCVPKIVGDPADAANPLALAESRPGLAHIAESIEDAQEHERDDRCPTPCSETDQARFAKFCFCAPRAAETDRQWSVTA